MKARTMTMIQSKKLPKWSGVALFILIWAVVAWLLYPLLVLDSVDLINAKSYFYRSAFGIILLIILFGKTITDLLMPIDVSRKKALSYTIFLTVYSLVLMGGIVYMIARAILVYLNTSVNNDTSLPF
jgi:hypothetical protein